MTNLTADLWRFSINSIGSVCSNISIFSPWAFVIQSWLSHLDGLRLCPSKVLCALMHGLSSAKIGIDIGHVPFSSFSKTLEFANF
jgi:hypothetical protein